MRDADLKIDDVKARLLFAREPGYRYFITEPRHRLGFAAVFRRPAFVVYNLNSDSGSG